MKRSDDHIGSPHIWCSSLTYSSFAGHIAIVNSLIQAKANINHTNAKGSSPLIVSTSRGRLDVANALIRANADINQTTNTGHSSLIRSCQIGHLQLVNTLIQANAKVNLAILSYVQPTKPTRKVSYIKPTINRYIIFYNFERGVIVSV